MLKKTNTFIGKGLQEDPEVADALAKALWLVGEILKYGFFKSAFMCLASKKGKTDDEWSSMRRYGEYTPFPNKERVWKHFSTSCGEGASLLNAFMKARRIEFVLTRAITPEFVGVSIRVNFFISGKDLVWQQEFMTDPNGEVFGLFTAGIPELLK